MTRLSIEESSAKDQLEIRRLLVSVDTFCLMFEIGRTRAYGHLAARDVDSCLLGGSRRIDLDSIYAFKARLLAEQTK